jgi:predicted nucleotidyltransferase
MTTSSTATVSDAQLQQMAAEILQEIPGPEVLLFGSCVPGEARPSSDVDLMIIVTDAW